MKTNRFICFHLWMFQLLIQSIFKTRLFGCFSILLCTVGAIYSSPEVEHIGTKMDQEIELFIDQAPFILPNDIKGQKFNSLLTEISTSEIGRTNTRYWIKLPPASDLNVADELAYYYFGDFERILVYQFKNGAMEKIAEMGYLYKKSIRKISPHYLLCPINTLDPNKEVYVQLSSGFHMNAMIETINPYYIPIDNLRNFRFRSSFDLKKGIVQMGLLFYLVFMILLCISYNIIFSTNKLLSFSFVCFAFLLFSLRHIDGNFMTVVFWCHFTEGVLRYEILCRVMIFASFAFFSISNFHLGKYKHLLRNATIFTVIFGFFTAFYYASVVSPFTHFSPMMRNIYFLEILLTLFNSAAILFLIWQNDHSKFGRAFFYMTMLYLVISYLGLFLNTTWIGQLDNFLSSKMYSTYSIFLYLGVLATLALKDLKNRENNYQVERLENNRLHTLQQSQAKLYTDISHEIRSPLTIIQAALEDSEFSFGKKEILQKNSNQLIKIADHIRSLSTPKSTQVYKDFVCDDFVAYVKYLLTSFESVAEQKNIELCFYSTHEKYYMEYEQEGIRQIASNLISNAISFSNDRGMIEVSLDFKDNNCQWNILDSGRGIPDNNIEHIFNRHFTDHSLVTNQYDGTGIGLSLVKEIVNRIGGEIYCESEVDIGTEFNIIIPAVNKDNVNEAGIQGQQQTDNEQFSFYSTDDTIILIVEDNLDVQHYIKKSLDEHYQLMTATNGEVAYQLAKEHLPDLIISDIVMPGMDGYQLIELIKSNSKTNHIPLILLTGKSGQREKENGLSYGVDAFLTKPFSKNELQLTVTNILDRAERLRKKFASTPHKRRKEIPEWLKSLHQILEDQIAEDISIENMSRKLFMSRTQLHRKIKSISGQSTRQYIKNYKMNEAKNQLQFTDCVITDIAYNLGYKNPGHFATDFKKHVGQSPTAFRKSESLKIS